MSCSTWAQQQGDWREGRGQEWVAHYPDKLSPLGNHTAEVSRPSVATVLPSLWAASNPFFRTGFLFTSSLCSQSILSYAILRIPRYAVDNFTLCHLYVLHLVSLEQVDSLSKLEPTHIWPEVLPHFRVSMDTENCVYVYLGWHRIILLSDMLPWQGDNAYILLTRLTKEG